MTIHHSTAGDGPDLVLVHGLTDSSQTWGPVTAMLAKNYRVTALDLRGMGLSGDASDYSSLAMVEDVVEAVEAAHVTSPLVVGHSLGGVVATAYAGVGEVRGTINVDQSLRLSAFKEALMQVEQMLRDPNSFPATIEAVFEGLDGDQLPAEIKADIARHRRPRQEVVLGVWDQVFTMSTADLDSLMGQLTSTVSGPYLSLHYIDPGADYAAWLQGLIPQAVVEHPKPSSGEYGHYGHRIDPQRFVDRVIAFDH